MSKKSDETADDKKIAFIQSRLAAQKEVHAELAEARVNVYNLREDLDDLQGEEDYSEALLEIVRSAGKEGIYSADLREILPNSKKLTVARESLAKTKDFIAVKDSNSWLMKFVSPEQPAAD